MSDSPGSGLPVIELRDVHKRHASGDGEIRVLRGACLEVRAGESVAVVGPSGSGKSTLLNLIGGLDDPSSGTIVVGGREPAAACEAERSAFRSRTIGFVFQDHHLLPQCTAVENVMLPALAAGTTAGAFERASALLELVGLSDRAHAFPARLSGGERQRVAVARALVNGPAVLLCDEPTGSLDRETADRVARLLAGLVAARRVAMVVVTHSQELAGACSRIVRLHDGVLLPAGGAAP